MNLFPAFLIFQVILFFLIHKSNGSTNHRHKSSVTISLNSNWHQTPLYLEACEFLAEENGEFMWNFVDLLYEKLGPDAIGKMSPRDQYDIINELANQILESENKLAVLKFSLSLRAHSPAVAMFNQMANELIRQQSGKLDHCNSFVEINVPQNLEHLFDRFACDVNAFNAIIDGLEKAQAQFTSPFIHKIDHIYPSSFDSSLTVILYGEVGSNSFLKFHLILSQLAHSGKIKYLVRYFVKKQSNSKVSLSGYGVELAIKSTEYKAQDDARVKGEETQSTEALKNEPDKPSEIQGFVFSKLKSQNPDYIEKLDEFQTHLYESSKEIANLKVWEMQELSLQTAAKILSVQNNDSLKLLREISQNFPVQAKTLTKISVDSEMKKEIDRNQQIFMQNLNLAPTDAALFINGLYFDAETVDVFTLLNIVKQELKLVEGLHKLVDGDKKRINKLISLDVNSDKHEYQIDIRDGSIVYINDIENDKMYKNWPTSLQDMLRAMYPGMLRNVRRNIFHLIMIIDPSKKEAHDIIKLAESFYIHKAPVRIGLIFAVTPDMSVDGFHDAGVACLEAFNFVSQEKSLYDGLSFLTDVIANVNSDSSEQRDLNPEDVINIFKKKYKSEDMEMVFGSDSDYDTGRRLAWEFINKTGIGSPIKVLLNGVVLKDTYLNAELFEEAVLTEIMKQTNTIQKAIYKGELIDSDNVLDWLMNQKNVMPRLNKLILNTENSLKYLELNNLESSLKSNDYKNMNFKDLQQVFLKTINHISSNDQKCKPVTVWLALNLDTKIGCQTLLAALSHLRSSSIYMRIGIVHNKFTQIGQIIEAAISTIAKSNHLINFLTKFITEINQQYQNEKIDDPFIYAIKFIQQDYVDKFKKQYNDLNEKSDIFILHNEFRAKILSIDQDDMATVLNGRVIKVPLNEPFSEEDMNLIEKYSMTTFADKILSQLNENEISNANECSNMLLKISSVLLAFPQSKTRHEVKYSGDKHSTLFIQPKHPILPAINIIVIMDPLTRGAQKIVPILITFHQVFNSEIKIFFNCVDKHSEMPLKNFFRFVISTEPNFGNAGPNDMPSSSAVFSSIPNSALLTLGMATPENWLVESVRSPYDLDNIYLKEMHSVWADFELEHLLLEGHCFELTTGNPPRGLQFTLGTNSTSTPVLVDTIVMANLGYFQLKANPGSWLLQLRQGRSEDIYNIISHEGTDSPSSSPNVTILISNFRSNVIKIRVNKKPGKQHEELLYDHDDDDDEVNSIWNSFSWSSENKKKESKAIEESEDSKRINVFSLASGHLYERLLRIMMLSVIKNTKTPVKFWFLKNYLSPTFKQVLPYLAEKYNFEYELVQYKWPRWLHSQTEKQRIIWGYKILFLDVLFPLDVKKIIYIDADQVVRADLKELRDLDLEGAPYGYTPFCDSRTDMEGYRFWKSGYWSVHLHGRKYHISALYVVDLQKFRRIAAGDRLRGQYQGLSQDPNSLSNLDQDLPNNMIHQVSIRSLPQEWLWCETWCDDESKKTAKTIDLCNNPKTKEPKLTSARRIIPEWESYDNEIKESLKELEMLKSNKTEKKVKQTDSVKQQNQHQNSHSEL